MHNYRKNTPHRVPSLNQLRQHNCPNCQCNPNRHSQPLHPSNFRPTSPNSCNITKFVQSSKITNLHKKQIPGHYFVAQRGCFGGNAVIAKVEEKLYANKIDRMDYYNNNQNSSKCILLTAPKQKYFSANKVSYYQTFNSSNRILSPLKKQLKVNIRYTSPGRNSCDETSIRPLSPNFNVVSGVVANFQHTCPSIYYDRSRVEVKKQQELKYNTQLNSQYFSCRKQVQQQPKVPTILKRKKPQKNKLINSSSALQLQTQTTYQQCKQNSNTEQLKQSKTSSDTKQKLDKEKDQETNDRTKSKQGSFVKSRDSFSYIDRIKQNQFIQQKNQWKEKQNGQVELGGTFSSIMSGKIIETSHQIKNPPNHKKQSKGKWDSQFAHDLFPQQQHDRAFAHELIKDLKLNYDYYQTKDVSKLSGNIY